MMENVTTNSILNCRRLCHAACCHQNQEDNQTNILADLLHCRSLLLEYLTVELQMNMSKYGSGMVLQSCFGFIYTSIGEGETDIFIFLVVVVGSQIHFFLGKGE
jgi:hypothetical protein